MTRFLFIRHATNDTIGKRIAARTPGVHLNEEGRQQAQQLAQRLKGLAVDAIYSSPMERTIETATPVADVLQLPIVTMDDFLEIDFGEWTNQTHEDLDKMRGFKLFNTFRSSTQIPGGELMIDAQSRVIKGLQKLLLKHPNQTVAVVSHGDPIKSAITWYAGIHLDLFHRIEISPASVSIIELYDETARIMLLNHTGEIKW
jgi:broad specificity phosphatase PhoE